MADTSQERTEEATPKRQREARERGEVARSPDVGSAAILAAGLLCILYQGAGMFSQMRVMMQGTLAHAADPDPSQGLALAALADAITAAGLAIAPLLLAVTVTAALAGFMQVGPLLVSAPLVPTLSRLNPAQGLQRMFFSSQAAIELLKSALKIALVAALCLNVLNQEKRTLLMLALLPVPDAAAQVARIVIRCAQHTLLAFAVLGLADYLHKLFEQRSKLRMTREEVKQEYKEQEGDPHHKHQRRRMHEEIASGMMLRQVEKAHVIVTNPTHIACALRYDPKQDSAPRLVAKGEGHIAEQIRQIARQHDIPLLRDVPLARALHGLELDTEVPAEMYEAVAEVLKWVEMVARAEGWSPAWLESSKSPQVP